MKILFIAPSAYLLGGVQDWLVQLVPELRLLGNEVIIAVPNGTFHDYQKFCRAYSALSAVPFHNPSGSVYGRINSLTRLIKSVQCDIIVSVNIADVLLAIRKLRLEQSYYGRVVMTVHALESSYFSDIISNADILDAVITTNHLSSTILKQSNAIDTRRIFYAPYGVPVVKKSARNPPTIENLRIAWVGRLEQNQKRIHDLPDILKHLDKLLPSYKLTIAGDGLERCAILRRLHRWIESGHVKFVGKLTKKDLANKIFSTHHALLITSSWETGPIVAWEAMASGLAVVSSRFTGSGLEGALRHTQTALLFDTGDVQDAALQLSCLTQKPLFERITQQASRLVRDRYSIAQSTQKWVESLSNALLLPQLSTENIYPLGLQPAGKLDRVFGLSLAEDIRSWLGIRFNHSSPGAEWPHSHHVQDDDQTFLSKAEEIDKKP